MKRTGYDDHSWLRSTAAAVQKAVAMPLLVAFSGFASAEVYTGGDVKAYSGDAVAVPRDATELRIYKQGFEVTADVLCRVPKKGASHCKTSIGSEIDYQVQPEMILKYNSVRLDDEEFAAAITASLKKALGH